MKKIWIGIMFTFFAMATAGGAQDAIQAARLGLTAEAKAYVIKKCDRRSCDQRTCCQTPRSRFLPAWPPGWDVDFKLHAPQSTPVEGRVVNGKRMDLKGTPESRRKDVLVEGECD